MAQNQWKTKHPGVPHEWKQVGEGGNAFVWREGDFAIKRLKSGVSGEARERFKRECALMAELKDQPDLKIVPVVDVRHREEADEIVMIALEGNLEHVTDRFKDQPIKAASALVGVVDTLAQLAAREKQIHHRDLKPSNLLYKTTEEDLYLADFGCAYLAGDDRITPDKRALGAWAYRPPEYSGGRVEEVDEKGDVFSLGKILWSMINGVPDVTFPGPVWFLPEYDLTLLCPAGQRTAEAMYVIGKCCSIRPQGRPSLSQLKAMLEAMAANHELPETSLNANALRHEQEEDIQYLQRQSIARPFVLRLTEDLEHAFIHLQKSNPDSPRLNEWLTEWNKIQDRSSSLVEQVVVHESDAPVMNVLRRKEILLTRFYPEGMGGPLRFLASLGKQHEPERTPQLIVEARVAGLVASVEGLADQIKTTEYTPATITEFLSQAIEAYAAHTS